jgi:L-erythrulose 1-phosphate isomerase
MACKVPWIGTSWKMNKLRSEAQEFATTLKVSSVAQTQVVQPFVIPPFPSIAEVADTLKDSRIKVGAQNMHWDDSGAWTGEVSGLMIKDCGATLVEIGHSERRTYFNETDETVALKVQAALRHGLLALVCIGDTKAEYDAGETALVLERQTRAALKHVGKSAVAHVMFAYEPVWSIGVGGVPADPGFANEHHKKIKRITEEITGKVLPVLYGGSVNLDNCCELAARADIDGLFIGRSAWNVSGYIAIVEAVAAHLGTST